MNDRLPAERASYLSPAACAFIASGIEILAFGLSQFQRWRIVAAADSDFFLPPASVYIALLLGLLGVAAQARALWHVGGIQRAVAPSAARIGRWAVAAYVVISVLLFVLMSMTFSGFGLLETLPFGIVQLPRVVLTLAFAFLGWASRGDTRPWQRWASSGLLLIGALGILSVIWWLFGLPTGPRWLWLAGIHAALRAATWAAVGAWLMCVQKD